MSENPGASYFEYTNLENEFNYDWAVPGYPQPSPFEFNPETIPPHDSRDIRDYSLFKGDRANAKVAIPRNAQPSDRQLNDLTTRVETFDALLRSLYPKLDASSAQQVDQTLRELNARTPLTRVIPPTPIPALFTNPSSHTNQSEFSSRADDSPISILSAVVDYTEEDFDRDEKVQATGFVGEHSEMAWLYRLKRDLDHNSSKGTKEILERPSISSVNYFQDDSGILFLDDIDLACRPPQPIANRLVDTYFHVVHPTFPIIGKAIFLNQYRSFYANPNVRPGKRWIIVLNLVFAIATRHSVLIDQPQPNCDDHQTYFARAWKLNAQVEGLAAFYLLSVGQVNRSWRLIGIAIRSAVTMGLNIRTESDSITNFLKALRYRVWWALFMLDIVLCEMTGRPPSTGDIFCSTPLPVPFVEEGFWDKRILQVITDQRTRSAFLASLTSDTTAASPKESMDLGTPEQHGSGKGKQKEKASQTGAVNLTPNSSLYFLYAVDLAHLLREAINTLYAPRAMRRSWHDIEIAIPTLNNHADNWLSRLPAQFDFTTLDTDHQFMQHRSSLAFRLYATKLIILHPCIRRLFQQSETSSSGTVCEQMAALCVQMAGQMLDLLPEEPDSTWLYSVAPWWCVLHNIMQATTILLTELLIRTNIGTAKAVDITKNIKKATRWLKEMSTKDLSSQRAWLVCIDLLSRHGSRFGFGDDTEL
ncbi:Transcription factor, fungi [Penicillium expansum]|uniref:Transcription factor, fungi n=1 Tax=Penicillium expansum TaxID=27334 RepID=A0A0A2IU04_PENEN|nr:Transcription factor, fungi [Penicillium expansum]KGO43630.1 Transcription factor, fungi [Penicillium expansum]KGO52840.1 Transcription factor, fungi [Penicillium expansum]